jgi:hypothetical protein
VKLISKLAGCEGVKIGSRYEEMKRSNSPLLTAVLSNSNDFCNVSVSEMLPIPRSRHLGVGAVVQVVESKSRGSVVSGVRCVYAVWFVWHRLLRVRGTHVSNAQITLLRRAPTLC